MLTYNTHGLPAYAAFDDPVRRFPRIGAKARAYDVVLLQEDFRYHAKLREGSGPWTVKQGNPSRFADSMLCVLLCDGGGLTLATALPVEAILKLERRAYETCSGWLLGANDCLATKGFMHARLRVGDHVVNFVNTHLDAGRSHEDRAARKAQLAELRDYLSVAAGSAPIVLGGDLNLDADDPADTALRDEFAAALGLADTGAAAAPDGAWTRLDYLYRRDGGTTALDVLEVGEAREFVDEAGAPLSDHPALFARLRARYRSPTIPPSTGITAPLTYAPARDAR